MNFKALAIAILAAAAACAPAQAKTVEYAGKVVVCLDNYLSDPAIDRAERMAFLMFREAGVELEWRETRSSCRKSPERPLVIDLLEKTPADASPTAKARAFPYEGAHIQIFMDRIWDAQGQIRTALLAHVLVHEITHILEGVPRHSETGIMKAAWTQRECDGMKLVPMRFAPEDIELIHTGLIRRAAEGTAHSLLAGDITARGAAKTR